MKVIPFKEITGPLVVEPAIYHDNRGFFLERFNVSQFANVGLPTNFVQDNHSRSKPQVVRGLHYQTDPSQGKLVGVIRGRIWDVIVDIRPWSPTYLKHVSVELDDQYMRLVWVPAGFAHGFCVLGDEVADVVYKVDAAHNPKSEAGIRWDDPALDILWPVKDPILSQKDLNLPTL